MTKVQNKDQFKRTFDVFQEQPLTMLQAARVLNIERANICRYVRTLRLQNKIAVVRKTLCPITKHEAGLLTTDSNLFPKPQQLCLFNEN
jgi:hypothetical protein